jgi:iron complex outermembrane recepter protein
MLDLARERLLASTILGGFAAGLAFAGAAYAQAPATTPAPAAAPAAPAADAAPEGEEEVVVTGTRIQRPGITSNSPITTVGRKDIDFAQTPEVERLLRNLPAAVPGDGANVNNGTAGVSSVNLRGLGAQRNVILLDGKRMVPYDINGIVDVSNIPIAMLERIDIVTGGASAVYGSDAISGAVNFILKKDFEGIEVDTEYSLTGSGDGNQVIASAVMGSNLADDRGNVTLAITYTNRQGVQFGQRDYGRVGVDSISGAGLGVTGGAEPANCSGENTVPTTFGGSGTTLPARINLSGPGGGPGGIQFRNDGTLGANCNQFNFNPYNYYQTPQDRYGAVAVARYKINENVEAYGKFIFANTTVRQQIAPSGIFNSRFNVPFNNPFLTPAARAEMAARYAAWVAGAPGRTLAAAGVTDSNTNGVFDAGDVASILIGRRTVEFGERSSTYKNNAFQITLGLNGTIGENWDWDVSYQRGQTTRLEIAAGYTNVTNAATAVNTVSATECRTQAGAVTAGCVPLNLFGPQGSITPAMAAYSSATALQDSTYTQDIVSASLSGSIPQIKSPWAETPVALALGFEYRREKGTTTPDECFKLAPASCLGGAGGNRLPIAGGYDTYETFAEVIAPIVENKPGFHLLQIEVGYRYSDFDPTGQTRSWKAGIEWAPIEGLRFRAMQQRAVRAPNVGELAAPLVSSLDNAVRDPCSVAQPLAQRTAALQALCLASGQNAAQVWNVADIVAGQINTFSGTNVARLPQPEFADTTTIGMVFQPKFLGSAIINPVVTLDYYRIKIDGVIGQFTAQEILDGCYVRGIAAFCNDVVRLNGNLLEAGSGLRTFTTNLLFAEAAGLELGFAFGLDLDVLFGATNAGRLDFQFNGNYYMTNESQSAITSPVIDCVGFYGNNCGNPTHEYRWNLRTTYSWNDLQVSAFWRHLSETSVDVPQIADTFPGFRRIGAKDYLDLAVSYQLFESTGLTLAVSNVFDLNPPIVGGNIAGTAANGGNTFPSAFDTVGRVWSFGVNLRF